MRIDGTLVEGGGQIVRSAVAIAAVRGIAVEIVDIRGRRPNPGLQAQHLTAVRAAAAVCDARLAGDHLGSRRLVFEPRRAAQAGSWHFDVAAAREGGSAGSAGLVLQTVALPLLLAGAPSQLVVAGGTHLPASPCYDFLELVWAPALAALGLDVQLALDAYGFYPRGGGQIRAQLRGAAVPAPLARCDPGGLTCVEVRAIAAALPAHIPQRMSDRARALLTAEGVQPRLMPRRVRAASPGALSFIAARYAAGACGFTAFGAPGKPAERVAEEAVQLFAEHRASGAAVDRWLADQLLLPLAMAGGISRFTTDVVTTHLTTQAEVLRLFALAEVTITQGEGHALVTVAPRG